MPELPEVETIKVYLKRFISGAKIVDFRNLDKKRIKVDPKEIINQTILDIQRRGKMLIFKLPNDKLLIFHLKMSGQIIYLNEAKIDEKDLKHTRAIFKLDRGYLIFNDPRRFGWLKTDKKEIEKLGIEPLSQEFNLKNLQKIFSRTKRMIKIVLMDQRRIAGIGNIYASESLFLARVNPRKPANTLTTEEIRRLKNSVVKILRKALRYEGTSSRLYLKPDGSKGSYQERFLVYQREGKKCLRCRNKIKKIILGGRSTFYCPKCQRS